MQITSFSIYRYKLPLAAPLKFPLQMLYRREGLLLRAASRSGDVGWGEAAPLPGFSKERLQEATRQAFKLKRIMTGRAVSDDWSDLRHNLEAELGEMTLAPSVRFGFEMALWSLYADIHETTVPALLVDEPRATVSYNGLIDSEADEDVLEQAHALRDGGLRAVKLKVGRGSIDDDIDRVEAVRQALGGDVTLRLDANQAWDMDEALAFAEGTKGVEYEYIEEPLFNPDELPAFAEQSGVAVALDESLTDIAPGALAEHDYAAALVIKPTILGGIAHALELAETARGLGMDTVVSGAYETGVGTMGLVMLAACLDGRDVPMGLDTYRRLDTDVCRPRLKMEGGQIDVESALQTKRTMNGHLLREV